MSAMKDITPLVPVINIGKSVTFYKDYLGFEPTVQMDEDYAYLKRDEVGIRLLAAGEGVDLKDPKRQQSCYIDVTNIDDLYMELKPKLDQLPAGRVRPPFNTDYGQREFHVIDIDALLIIFGEGIAK